jgi:hypothetical protein
MSFVITVGDSRSLIQVSEASAMRKVTVGGWTIEGDSDREIFLKYVRGTLESMSALDGVVLPPELIAGIAELVATIPDDRLQGCMEDAEENV